MSNYVAPSKEEWEVAVEDAWARMQGCRIVSLRRLPGLTLTPPHIIERIERYRARYEAGLPIFDSEQGVTYVGYIEEEELSSEEAKRQKSVLTAEDMGCAVHEYHEDKIGRRRKRMSPESLANIAAAAQRRKRLSSAN